MPDGLPHRRNGGGAASLPPDTPRTVRPSGPMWWVRSSSHVPSPPLPHRTVRTAFSPAGSPTGDLRSPGPYRQTARTSRRSGDPTGAGATARDRSAAPPRQCTHLEGRVPTNRSVRTPDRCRGATRSPPGHLATRSVVTTPPSAPRLARRLVGTSERRGGVVGGTSGCVTSLFAGVGGLLAFTVPGMHEFIGRQDSPWGAPVVCA